MLLLVPLPQDGIAAAAAAAAAAASSRTVQNLARALAHHRMVAEANACDLAASTAALQVRTTGP
jgi:hypothetical protein